MLFVGNFIAVNGLEHLLKLCLAFLSTGGLKGHLAKKTLVLDKLRSVSVILLVAVSSVLMNLQCILNEVSFNQTRVTQVMY